MYALVLFTFDL
jgi:hypothetical protein